jgi:hypothetical protein
MFKKLSNTWEINLPLVFIRLTPYKGTSRPVVTNWYVLRFHPTALHPLLPANSLSVLKLDKRYFSFCLQHEGTEWCGETAPLILNIDSRERRVDTFALRSLHADKSSCYPVNTVLCGAHTRSACYAIRCPYVTFGNVAMFLWLSNPTSHSAKQGLTNHLSQTESCWGLL